MRSLPLVLGASALVSVFVLGCSGGEEATGTADQHVTEGSSFIDDSCGGTGWVSADSFQTLAGSYARTGKAAKGVLASITFADTSSPDHLRVGGSYTSTFEGGSSEKGAFSSLPDNAAFPANILLDPTGALATGAPSASSSMYFTLGMKRAPNGDISSLCMEHMINATTAEPVIILERTAADGAEK